MNTPHPVFVLIVVALVGTVGIEYGFDSDRVVSSTEHQSLVAATDRAHVTPTPSPTAVSTAVVTPSAIVSDSPVEMRVGRVTACGSTCRDVTAHLHNDGSVDMTNVEVYTTIYAGTKIVWVDAERVGTVTAGDTYTTTKRVEVGPDAILQIHANDGSVRVETVIESDQGSTVVTEDVDVV